MTWQRRRPPRERRGSTSLADGSWDGYSKPNRSNKASRWSNIEEPQASVDSEQRIPVGPMIVLLIERTAPDERRTAT